MGWQIYTADGLLKTSSVAVDATNVSGIVDSAHGGTQANLSGQSGVVVMDTGIAETQSTTGTGLIVRDTSPTLTSPVVNTGISGTAIDTDSALAANLDTLLATQKAVKTHVSLYQRNKTYVNTVSDTNLTATYSNGASGVGATLESTSNTTLTIDGQLMTLNMRVLVAGQSSAFQNGIYYVSATGSGAAHWVLTRATDADTPGKLDRCTVHVRYGDSYYQTTWTWLNSPTTIGTDSISPFLIGSGPLGRINLSGTLPNTRGIIDQDNNDILYGWDGYKAKPFSPVGFAPYAYPVNFNPANAFTTALSLPANGGSILIPMLIPAPMDLYSVSIRNTDTTLARAWHFFIYRQHSQQRAASSDENSLTPIAYGVNDSFTAAAASTRTLAATSSGAFPYYLPAGIIWIAIVNAHATNTLGLGSTANSAAFAPNTARTKTITIPSFPTSQPLDLSSGWANVTACYAVRLNGSVFGESAGF